LIEQSKHLLRGGFQLLDIGHAFFETIRLKAARGGNAEIVHVVVRLLDRPERRQVLETLARRAVPLA